MMAITIITLYTFTIICKWTMWSSSTYCLAKMVKHGVLLFTGLWTIGWYHTLILQSGRLNSKLWSYLGATCYRMYILRYQWVRFIYSANVGVIPCEWKEVLKGPFKLQDPEWRSYLLTQVADMEVQWQLSARWQVSTCALQMHICIV